MASTYTLEITPLRAPDVRRVVEVTSTSTLSELHVLIQREFELDDDHHYAFFMTNKAWDQKGAFGSSDQDPTRASLASFQMKQGREFLYLFDFGDELRHRIRVRDVGTAEKGVKYPRMVESIGRPPRQYSNEIDEELGAIGEEVAAAVRAWDEYGTSAEREENGEQADGEAAEGDAEEEADAEEEEIDEGTLPLRELSVVRSDAALAHRFLDALRGRTDQFSSVNELFDIYADEWLDDIPFELAEHGLVDEAIDLCAKTYEILAWVDALGHRALLLARAKRHDEARQQLAELEARFPTESDVLDQRADVLVELGDHAEAEALSRRVRAQTKGKDLLLEIWLSSTERLVELLRGQGEEEEADELQQELEDALEEAKAGALAEREDEDWDDDDEEGSVIEAAPPPPAYFPDGGTVRREGPKVGRNEPCPCGSGKKFKKCCGG